MSEKKTYILVVVPRSPRIEDDSDLFYLLSEDEFNKYLTTIDDRTLRGENKDHFRVNFRTPYRLAHLRDFSMRSRMTGLGWGDVSLTITAKYILSPLSSIDPS
jgi:hypothetical protein